jgi:hypothetical protein
MKEKRMSGTRRKTATLALLGLVFQGLLPAMAANPATLEGTVQIPCDPSMVGDVASVYMRALSGGAITTIPVDPETGAFRSPELTEGEYEVFAMGLDGLPLTPEPKKLVLVAGANQIVVSIRPPGCDEQAADPGKKAGKNRKGLEDWKMTLIYAGAITAIVLAVDTDAEEEPASPF